ncbi:retromer complex subunit Vps35 [Malassezia nana]|uniref:Vacuolar protein sorting-associated protein 35 n=1 Tax=Malassezia nana TaxID=180528 RepID=A0AAF0EKS3_9BASI|nr:retromer complex subunit Vps35 [Malassezia nana]
MEEWNKTLNEALNVVKVQGVQMKRYLDTDRVMDALKSASTMLNELRSSALSPKHYYELYMAVFDSLRHLSIYIYDAHMSEKHHLADLYELVQYCGNIVPRLYLMVTVGSVYMSVPDAPIKEIMKDMMEMCRGVQHPTRGLFIRHYLSGTTRDHLPTGTEPGPAGDLNDSISFILANFVEMNKLWVRQQHLGHSREREKREAERRELRILVGTNLVRLSQLDGVTLEIYQQVILPAILEQVINCKDVIAQEYLMEVIIQVFPDDFHLRTLSLLLSACARLHSKVSIKQIVIALINRLAAYAAREAESETPEERKRQEDEASARLLRKTKEMRKHVNIIQPAAVWREIAEEQTKSRDSWSLLASDLGQALQDDGPNIWGDTPKPAPAMETSAWAEEAQDEAPTSDPVEQDTPQDVPEERPSAPALGPPASAMPRRFRGIPEDVRLFEVFWEQIVLLIRARPDLSMYDTAVLLHSLLNLSLSCYPDRLEYVDQVLGFAISRIQEAMQGEQSMPAVPQNHFQALLLAPIHAYVSALTVLAIPNYHALWVQQQPLAQRAIAQVIVHSILRRQTVIGTSEEAHGILELCASLIRDKGEASAVSAATSHEQGNDEFAEQQGMLARLVHLFRSDDLDMQLVLLYTARKHYAEGGESIRFTYPSLITDAIALVRRYGVRKQEKNWEQKMTTLFHFVHQIISTLYHRVEMPELSMRLFLLLAEVADEAGFEEMAYEFYVQSFSIFEESISDSRSQLQAIGLIIGTLYKARIFGPDNYDTLITKAALYAAKLLKRPHQAAAVLMASHLWWQLPGPKDVGEPRFPLVKDGRRVLECLQKTLRIANGCINEYATVEIFCHALSKYLYYVRIRPLTCQFDQGVEAVTARYINSLVDLITKALASLQADSQARAPGWRNEADMSPTWDAVQQHFYNQLLYIQAKKSLVSEADTGSVAAPDWASLQIEEALEKIAPS